MSEIKAPPPPPAGQHPRLPRLPDGSVIQWFARRFFPNLGHTPAVDVSSDALRAAPAEGAEKPETGAPVGYEIPFADAKRQLSAIHAIGASDNKSIWDSLQARSRDERLGDALEAGRQVPEIVSAWVQFNNAGGFANAHEDGTSEGAAVWRALIAGTNHVTPTSGAPTKDLPPTKDVHQAFLRLEDGIGWAGNGLVPDAYAYALAANANRPAGYEESDPLLVLFVFGFGADVAANPQYAEMYAGLTAEEFLALQFRVSQRGPSGPDETRPFPGPGGKAPKTPKGKS